jgi:hypothetical protein
MSPLGKIAVTVLFVAVLTGLGATDAILTQDQFRSPSISPAITTTDGSTVTDASSSASAQGILPQSGPDVFDVLNDFSITTQSTQEESLIAKVVKDAAPIETRVLLKDNDRIAFLAWVQTPQVKQIFANLKEGLHTSFSDQLTDLVDETQERPSKPIRNVVSFLDPAIHDERLLFIRVRQRLFEFHIAPGKEEVVQQVMEGLTE